MKKAKTKKAVTMISVILLFVAGYLFYSRPMTIQQRYSMLNLDKCTGLSGYFEIKGQTEFTEFTIEKNSKEYEMLCDLLYEQSYQCSLSNFLPRGTRIHLAESGDFEWEVFFCFENVVLPDGSIGSGGILRIQYWYGELDIHFDGEIVACYTDEQAAWAKEVLNIIQ